jgi:hypothetical protein
LISIPAAFLICTVVVLSVGLLVWRDASVARELTKAPDNSLFDDNADLLYCPPEFVARVFSPDDRNFVASARSPQLTKLFRRERKIVALVWVHQTKTAIHQIMREHKRLTSQSIDLSLATEARLLCNYLQLVAICDLLAFAIQTAGPIRVGALATYAASLSQRFAEAQNAFAITTTARELRSASAGR